MKLFRLFLLGFFIYLSSVYCLTQTVTNNNDNGPESLREAITNINAENDQSNTIDMQIPENIPISLQSDLPVIKKNTVINSTRKQPIDGGGQYRLFATIMADLTINNCTLQNGAAIGGDGFYGGGGGMGAGGGVYIDRGNLLILRNTNIVLSRAEGGKGKGAVELEISGGGGEQVLLYLNTRQKEREVEIILELSIKAELMMAQNILLAMEVPLVY